MNFLPLSFPNTSPQRTYIVGASEQNPNYCSQASKPPFPPTLHHKVNSLKTVYYSSTKRRQLGEHWMWQEQHLIITGINARKLKTIPEMVQK